MKDLLVKHRNKIVTLVLVTMPMVMIATSAGAGVGEDPQTPPGRLARAGLGWGHVGVIRVMGNVGGWLDRAFASELAEENERLEREVARLREEKARLIGVLQENARLRELVGFRRAHPEFELVPARVIARDTTPYFRVIKIRVRLEGAHIEPRMPVVVAGGVVGQVHQVYDGFADVVVLSDPRSRVDAVSQRNRAHGVVQGLGHERDYQARVAYLSEKDSVRVGDVMVTSGMGGVFPRELIIGSVTEVAPDERGLFQEVTLEPAVDLSRLDEVFIITGKIRAGEGQP